MAVHTSSPVTVLISVLVVNITFRPASRISVIAGCAVTTSPAVIGRR
jgi:hypothetical protein